MGGREGSVGFWREERASDAREREREREREGGRQGTSEGRREGGREHEIAKRISRLKQGGL